MRSFLELQQYQKCIVLFMVGIVCSALGLIIYVIDPIQTIVQYNIEMHPDSLIFKLWRKPPIGIYVNVYIFNITNSEAFLNGEEKLKVQEIGPYVYQEMTENQNITWNENGTISYIPKRTIVFKPDLSIGNPDEDYVTVPNIPMLGISSALCNAGFFVNYPFIQLANYLDSQPILNITVHDYLWGYDDSLVKLVGTVIPSYINFQKFGLLDRMYDEGINLFNMNIKKNKDMIEEKGRYLSIETMNGSPGLSKWGYVEVEGNDTRPENTKCNRIQGSTEGAVFPSNIDTKAVFRVFRKAFCRPLPLVFIKEVENNGLAGYEYSLAEDFADPDERNSDKACYCRNNKCLKKGLMDLTPCYYNIPAAASLPHFLNADPSLLERIEGLKPNPQIHNTQIILQPTIGIPIYVHSRLQTNLIMKETRYNSKIVAFNDLIVPLFWTDVTIPTIPSDLLLLLKLGINIMPVVQVILVVLLIVGGVIAVLWSLFRTLVIAQEQQRIDNDRRNSTDLRISLGYGQYTAIRIMPTVKKFTSKSDLFM